MFRRKPRSKNSFLVLHTSNRGSDIVRPNNTSLIVNESDSEAEGLPKEVSIFSEDEEDNLESVRRSSSLMKSLTQKTQSTPLLLSQKRVLKENDNLQKHKTVNGSVKKISGYFEEVIRACGAVPLSENSSFKLSEDQAVFSVKVNDKLKGNHDNVKKFVDSVKEIVKDHENLQKLLTHTLTADDCEIARGPIQEPMMRMLLNVDCLQRDIVQLLLDVIADIVVDNKMESEHVQMVSSILQQMKFIGGLKDLIISDKLFEIIHVATLNVKREIIFLLPEIIPESETEETCNQLLDLLKFDEALTHVIVDALAHLPISKDVRSKVCVKVLSRLDKCPLEFLPSLVQFVLTKSLVEDLNEVVNGLRNNLPFTPQHYLMRNSSSRLGKDSDENSYIKLTFENLKFSVMASKEMTEIWIKVISNLNSCTDFRCVDFIMLIIFYSCLFGRKNQILQLIRAKVKSSVLHEVHVKNAFKILVVIVEEYCSPALEMASALLRSFETKVSNFGAVLYKECFIHFHFYMKKIVISEILLHVGTGTPGTVNTALSTLRELCECEKENLSQHIASIMGLLVKVQDLELPQVRLLMDVVSELVFYQSSGTEGSAAQDELEMFIQKQLISSKLDQCKKGVSAAVMYGKHAGKQVLENDSRNQINSLLDMARGSKGSCDFKTGFFNDEFATMTKESQLNKQFMEAWGKKTRSLVMNNLFVKDIDLKCADFPSSLQYSLDGGELVFPVVDLIVKSTDGVFLEVPLTVIPSTLRLLWCLEEDVDKILPVLYASVIMPDTSVYDSFKNIDETQRKNIMDCLFLCGNYLIECINALCAHGILQKAVLRVKQLINVRKLIAHHIDQIPGYIPPFCQFYALTQKITAKKKTVEKKPKKGRKRKLEPDMSTSLLETQPTPGPSAVCSEENVAPEPPAQEADLHVYSAFFRELDFDTHNLLITNLKPPDDSDHPELGTCEVLFLFEDLLYKSEQILKPSEVTFNLKSKSTGLIIQRVTPENFIEVSIKILSQLLCKITLFSKYCEGLLESNDWIYDSQGLFVQGAGHVKLAMAAGLKFIAEIISWKEFQNSSNKTLKDFLSALTGRENSNQETLASLASDAANILSGFGKTSLVLSGGISIVKSCEACLRYSSSESCRESLVALCLEFLCRSWFAVTGAPERGPVYNQHVDFLLKTYFSSVKDKLETVRVSAKTVFDEIGGLSGKDSTLKTFKTINKRNFPLLYRIMCEALVSASTKEFTRTNADDEEQLNVWNKIVETWLILVEMAKNHPSRVILASLLKRSQSIIQLFLSKGMPIVESALRVKSVKVLTLLKSFQMVTRFLHSICCHSRITNDSVVAAHVPAIRSQCERLTLEVKGMLILNGIPMDCITIAVLKNRDIKGNDIVSQETLDEDSDDDSELPPEDTPEEQPEPEHEIGDTQESNSESY